MPDRREFLALSGLSLAALGAGWGPFEADSTWLTYAPNLELFWSNRPFAARLKKLSEAGFTRYEFGRWKTKDTDAIAKLNEELGLQAALFTGYPGLRKWKEGLLETIAEAGELGTKLGSLKATVFAADRNEDVDRDEQVDELVDALKESVELVAETETVLVLEPGRVVPNRPRPLIASADEAAAVAKAVNSDRVRFLFPIGRPDVAEGKVSDQIRKHKDLAGYYRLDDFAPGDEAGYARVLRTIHDVGYPDPIGLGLAPKGDPQAAIDAIRKLDEAAKAL